MDRCLNVVKLLMVERGLEAPEEKERLRAEIRAHVATCGDCAAIFEGLTAPVDEAAMATWRALIARAPSTVGSAPQLPGLERGRDNADAPVTVFVDEAELRAPRRSNGAELMALAAIPPDAALIRVHADGSQELIGAHETVELRAGDRFRRAPRFARG
jgi:hypothetical protein